MSKDNDFVPVRCSLVDSPIVKALAEELMQHGIEQSKGPVQDHWETYALGVLVSFWVHVRKNIDDDGCIPYVDHPVMRAIESIGYVEYGTAMKQGEDMLRVPEPDHWITAQFRRVSKKPRDYGPYFDEFWDAVWSKVGKQAAERAYHTAHGKLMNERGMRGEDAHEYLVEAVREFAASPAGRRGRYTPHPATWLNAGRYDDDRKAWQLDEPEKDVEDDARRQMERLT